MKRPNPKEYALTSGVIKPLVMRYITDLERHINWLEGTSTCPNLTPNIFDHTCVPAEEKLEAVSVPSADC